jgi:uncharacterized cupredoxin-like copper-binding protein
MTTRPHPTNRLALASALLALAPLLGGCAASTVDVRGHQLALTLSEFQIAPQNVSMPAGTIVLVAHNRGILTHSLAVEREGPEPEAEPVVLARTGAILPGATGSLTITLRRKGRYELQSTIANQGDLGMNGTLTIR